MTNEWRGPINQLLYSLTFTREITDETVTYIADTAVNYTALGLGPEVYYQAINDALASGEELRGHATVLPQFDDATLASYLRALADRLDALRPWPVRRYHPLHESEWKNFEHAVPIAKLDDSMADVTNLLLEWFDPIGDPSLGQYALMLQLNTGEPVAMVGSDSPGEQITVLTDPSYDAEKVIEHFVAATSVPADKITRIESDGP